MRHNIGYLIAGLIDRFYAQCTEKKPEFDALVTRLAQQTGSEPLLVPLKSNERALEKVITSLGGKLDGLTDVLRATLVHRPANRLDNLPQQRSADIRPAKRLG